jgi:hypothetical protein
MNKDYETRTEQNASQSDSRANEPTAEYRGNSNFTMHGNCHRTINEGITWDELEKRLFPKLKSMFQ